MDKLRNMEVFMAVVEDGSFAQAARRLDISAVMVGKHVQQLEAHLGARLLQRTTRRMSLTTRDRPTTPSAAACSMNSMRWTSRCARSRSRWPAGCA